MNNTKFYLIARTLTKLKTFLIALAETLWATLASHTVGEVGHSIYAKDAPHLS